MQVKNLLFTSSKLAIQMSLIAYTQYGVQISKELSEFRKQVQWNRYQSIMRSTPCVGLQPRYVG